MAAKKKARIPGEESFKNIERRVEEANQTSNLIGAWAYGKEPQTLSMPSELAGTPLGGGFTTPLSLPDPNDDSAEVPLSRILQFKNEGINTSDPGEIVRRAWNMPPQTPTAKGSFMQRYKESRKTEPSRKALVQTATNKLREIVTKPEFAENKKELGLSTTASPESVFNAMVDSRKSHLSSQLTDWYEGKYLGINEKGYPQYEQGSAIKAIAQKAEQTNIPEAELRRGTALGSPKTVWQSKSGYMPNLEGSAETMIIARDNPDLTPAQVTKQMKSTFAKKTKDKGTILGSMAPQVARSARGELSRPYEPTTPAQGKQIGSEKVANFDLALVNPYHPEYGYSSWVAWQRSRPHTGDTHDMGAAGVKTPAVQRVDDQGRPRFITTKTGANMPVTTNAGEDWAEKAGGQDLLGASALVASSEKFLDESAGKSADWIRQNAHVFTRSNAQANMWVESMARNKARSAARRAGSLRNRKK